MRIPNVAVIAAALFAGGALVAVAKLPPPTDEAKAKSVEAAAKGAWADKVGAYQLCVAGDRVADAYRRNVKASGKEIPAPAATAPCADPGPFQATPVTPESSKPLEASGAHSPPGTAVSPPSTKATANEIANKKSP